MAFGGKLNRGPRFDTRRFRRVDPSGPHLGEQVKLIGSKRSLGLYDHGYGERRRRLEKAAIEAEMRDSDMTPVPRRTAGHLVRLYLPGRTIIASAVLGDETFDNFFPQDENLPLFDGDPGKRHGDPSKGRFHRAKLSIRRRNARRRAALNNWGFVERTMPKDLPDGITVRYAS